MQKKSVAIGLSAAVLTAGIGLGVSQIANADQSTPTPTPSASASASSSPGSHHKGDAKGHGPRARGSEDLSTLASKLGVDETKLKEAMSAARKEVGDSDRTSRPTKAERTAQREAYVKALAKELGVDADKVTTALKEIAQEQREARQGEEKERLAKAVTDGTLSQAEADAVQKALDEGIVRLGGRVR